MTPAAAWRRNGFERHWLFANNVMSNVALGKLIWVLIFGGSLMAVLGLTIQKTDAALGWPMAVIGGLIAVVGAVLVVVRSRRKDGP
jgi:hypothetical protein